jgi:hypothetical protein
MDYSMADVTRRGWPWIAAPLFGVLLMSVALGCGSDASGDSGQRELNVIEAKTILQELPYRYAFKEPAIPQGASGAIGGRVYGPHKTWFDFGIALGDDASPVPVPRAGISEAVGNPGFVFTANQVIPVGRFHWKRAPQLRTAAQWDESSHMATEIVERLCYAVTGEPCPV